MIVKEKTKGILFGREIIMAYGLSLASLPRYSHSSFRHFAEGERHISRVCTEDVLIVMLDGTLSFKEDGKSILLGAGEYYIQMRGLKQEGDLPSSGARYYYLHFQGKYKENETDILPLRGRVDVQGLYSHFEKLEHLQSISASSVELSCEFFAILSALRAGEEITQGRKTLLKVLSLISGDYEKVWSLDELAVECGYSKNNLIRIFKQETGQPPLAYLTELRLGRAKVQLENSDLPLYEIARSCGFGSYINFYKCFRKAEGCPPEVWRKNHR